VGGGAIAGTPDDSVIEEAAHELGREASRLAQALRLNEVVADDPQFARCPKCGTCWPERRGKSPNWPPLNAMASESRRGRFAAGYNRGGQCGERTEMVENPFKSPETCGKVRQPRNGFLWRVVRTTSYMSAATSFGLASLAIVLGIRNNNGVQFIAGIFFLAFGFLVIVCFLFVRLFRK
jgi:hypothetical protein